MCLRFAGAAYGARVRSGPAAGSAAAVQAVAALVAVCRATLGDSTARQRLAPAPQSSGALPQAASMKSVQLAMVGPNPVSLYRTQFRDRHLPLWVHDSSLWCRGCAGGPAAPGHAQRYADVCRLGYTRFLHFSICLPHTSRREMPGLL